MSAPLRLLLRTARHLPPEAAIWTAALVALACTDPRAGGLVSLCVLKGLGLPFCPGCGLGHSIAFLLEGQWTAAVQAHPLGPVALPVLVGRITKFLPISFSDVRIAIAKSLMRKCSTCECSQR